MTLVVDSFTGDISEAPRAEARVIRKIRDRYTVGPQKYGTTTDRIDLTKLDWLRHLQEEMLDAAIYIEKVLEDPKP